MVNINMKKEICGPSHFMLLKWPLNLSNPALDDGSLCVREFRSQEASSLCEFWGVQL